MTFDDLEIALGAIAHLTSGETFAVAGTFDAPGISANRITLDATTPASKAVLNITTVGDVKHCDATDIDGSGGSAVVTKNGTVSNCDNWTVEQIKTEGMVLAEMGF